VIRLIRDPQGVSLLCSLLDADSLVIFFQRNRFVLPSVSILGDILPSVLITSVLLENRILIPLIARIASRPAFPLVHFRINVFLNVRLILAILDDLLLCILAALRSLLEPLVVGQDLLIQLVDQLQPLRDGVTRLLLHPSPRLCVIGVASERVLPLLLPRRGAAVGNADLVLGITLEDVLVARGDLREAAMFPLVDARRKPGHIHQLQLRLGLAIPLRSFAHSPAILAELDAHFFVIRAHCQANAGAATQTDSFVHLPIHQRSSLRNILVGDAAGYLMRIGLAMRIAILAGEGILRDIRASLL